MKSRSGSWLLAMGFWLTPLISGCRTAEIRPVDIFPEDNCAQCRMAVSNERFAAEIIDANGEVLKFDDFGCLLRYRTKHGDLKIAAVFLKDYETKEWTTYERAFIVDTNIETPMGSGKVAFADAEKAKSFQKQNSKVSSAGGADKCCE